MIISQLLFMGLLAAIMASISAGIVGSYVVVKRIVFISGSIAHTVLGGMGLFLYLNRTYNLPFLSPIYGALLMAVLSAQFIGWIHLKHRQREDTVIAALWALGMSVGVIFVSLTPGYNVDLMNFLFGNILWTSIYDILILAALDVVVLTVVFLFHKKFMGLCFDEVQCTLQGLKTTSLYFLLLTIIAIVVVLLIHVIGAILVIAMLCLPAAIANLFTQRLSFMMVFSVLICMAASLFGTLFSYALNWPPGATIALLSTLGYLSSVKIKKAL